MPIWPKTSITPHVHRVFFLVSVVFSCRFVSEVAPSLSLALKWAKKGGAVICLSQAPWIYILNFIVCNNFAWRSRGISWLFFWDWERKVSYDVMKMHTKHLSLPFLAFSLGGIVFPCEMQREDKTVAQIPRVGLPRLHKRALDLVAGLLWAVNRNQKAILELSHDPRGHVATSRWRHFLPASSLETSQTRPHPDTLTQTDWIP